MLRISNISLPATIDTPESLKKAAAKALGVKTDRLLEIHPRRRSVDARRKTDVRVIYTVDVSLAGGEASIRRGSNISVPNEIPYTIPHPSVIPDTRPVVAGFGPAGMFAALALSLAGLRPIVLERGEPIEKRREKVDLFWESGRLDPESNVQFGEGGAGTFSDGKLNTGTHDHRIVWVFKQFVKAGAPERILYDAKPHLGTDVLRSVVRNIRERIISLGGEVRFCAKLCGIETRAGELRSVSVSGPSGEYSIPCKHLILAIGHSARDTFQYLLSAGVTMEPKPFAMGLRIEHLQADIDKAQYGSFAGLGSLGAADYKLSCHLNSGLSVYTFCMCPGGYVVAAASEEGGLVTNGMSYSGRAGENANSALLVGLAPSDFPYPGPLGGMEWQREIERRAFRLGGGGYFAPFSTVGRLLGVSAHAPLAPTYRPGVTDCDIRELLPERLACAIAEALPLFGKRLHGFDSPNAVLTGPETRSSSPVRILRDKSCQSTIRGLYPCGEGAGYAGGITSSAVDGLRCAQALIESL